MSNGATLTNALPTCFASCTPRLKLIGLVSDGMFDLGDYAKQIAEATSLTAIHTNPMLEQARREVDRAKKRDPEGLGCQALARSGGFDDRYLHMRRRYEIM